MVEETRCGLGSCRPSWLQPLASKQVYVLLYAILGAVQGMGHTYLSSVLSSMEKQFGIKSEEAAWIFSGNEISQIFFIFFFPLLARIRRRSLWTSVAMLLSALGTFLCAFPFLLGEKSQYEGTWGDEAEERKHLCGEKVDEENCEHAGTGRDWSGMVTIFFGYFITGIGSSFFYSFGIPYIDDNVSKQSSPLVLSFILAGRTLGPSFGFLLGSATLRIYVYPGHQREGLTEGDPGFLGAWWLGFLIISAATAFLAPFLALFPPQLPSSESTDQKKMDREKADLPKSGENFVKETFECGKRLAKNKVYVFNALSTIFLLFGVVGFGTFVPKYFEYHFRKPASSSGNSGGLTKALSSVVGILLSGVVISKFRFRARILAGYSVVVGIATTLAFFSAAFVACPTLKVTEPDPSCLSSCSCTSLTFQPTCSLDGNSLFFSPCHAGCTNSSQERGKRGHPKTVYNSCSCLPSHSTSGPPWWRDNSLPNAESAVSPLASAKNTSPPSTSSSSSSASSLSLSSLSNVSFPAAASGHCPVDCSSSFRTLIGVLMVGSLLGATGRLGGQLVNLRAVEPRDKSASMIIMVALLSLCVFLPSPLVYGRIMDNACLVWGSHCGSRTHCLLYDTDLMRTTLFYMVSGFMLVSTLFDFGVWLYCGHVKVFDEDGGEGGSQDGETKGNMMMSETELKQVRL